MKDDTVDRPLVSRWALPGSLAAHLLVAALLIFGLPLPSFEPEPEEAITVDLVPPPEQAEVEPPPPEEEAKPEEPQQAEAEPPPPAEEAKPEEPQQAEAEPPPPAEEAKPEEPQQAESEPPPPAEEAKPEEPQQAEVEPPPPAEEAKPEEPQQAEAEPPPPAEEAKPEAPQQAKAEPPPSGGDVPPPLSVLQPVFQYGEKDAGPREAQDGNSAEDGSASPEAEQKPDEQEPAEQPAVLTAGPAGESSPDGTPDMPAAELSDVEKASESVPQPKEAKKLFSREATGDVIATTAMADVPRGVRAGRLCVTELREQLQNGLPPYYPDLLPSFRLADGTTVIDAQTAAFRMNGQWYDLSYRCEVDRNATKVVAFALRVGDALPRSEWRRRGLPLR